MNVKIQGKIIRQYFFMVTDSQTVTHLYLLYSLLQLGSLPEGILEKLCLIGALKLAVMLTLALQFLLKQRLL